MGRQVDGRSDVYSLGVVLSEMVTGRNSSAAEPSTSQLAPTIPAPSIPPELSRVITTATALDPNDRFQSADQLEAALGSVRARLSPPTPAFLGSRVAAIVGLGAIALAIMMVWVLDKGLSRHPTPHTTGARRAIAILGFKNSSGRPDVAWLSTAFAEVIGSELAAAQGVRLIPAETVARMKAELTLPEADSFARDTLSRVRADIGADLVLTGSFIALGSDDESQVRLDLRVQDAESGDTVAQVSRNSTTGRLFIS